MLVVRESRTGRVERRIRLNRRKADNWIGYGSVWVLWQDIRTAKVDRIDPLSGRRVTTMPLPRSVYVNPYSSVIRTGSGAVWVLDSDAKLTAIDPLTNRVSGTYRTGTISNNFTALGHYLWIQSRTRQPYLVRFDPQNSPDEEIHGV